jgi:integrase
MARQGLQDHEIRAAMKAGAKAELLDGTIGGLSVRVFPSGEASWSFRYRPQYGGGYRRVTMGRFPDVLVSEARKKAAALRTKVYEGDDPAVEKKVKRQAKTVAELAEQYLEDHIKIKKKPSTYGLYKIYRNHAVARLGTRKGFSITRADINSLHREIGATKTATANRVVDFLSGMFNYCAKEGVLPEGFNPTRGIEMFGEKNRERFLTNEELARLGEALRVAETEGLPWPESKAGEKKHARKPENRKTKLSPWTVAAFRLLILTGCRLREILHLRWDDVDLERGFFNLPDSKTGKRAVVLNAPAIAVLNGLEHVGDYVIFGESRDRPRADLKKPWDLVRAFAGLDGVRIHDLRHSFASVGAGGGLGLPIVGKNAGA